MARDRGAQEVKVNDNLDKSKDKNIKDDKDKKNEIKSFSGNIEIINLNLVIPTGSQDKLIEIKNNGTKSVFLKLLLGGDYQSNLDVSSINNKLFEYPVSQIMLDENSFIVKSYMYIADPEKFLVKTIGIYWVNETLLTNGKYQEVLLGFYSQQDYFFLKNAQQVDLTLTINYQK